jgi:PsbP-like protein
MNDKLMTSAITMGVIAATLLAGILAISAVLPNVAVAQTNTNASNTHNTTGSNAGLLTYENSTLGIKMQYPSNWTKQTTGRGVAFTVLLSHRNSTNPEQFLAKLNASALRGFPTNLTLKAMADRVVDSYRHFLNNLQVQSYSNTTLAGNNAVKIVYSYADSKNNVFNASDIATISNDKLYVIQYYYYAKSPRYQSYLEAFQKMVNSFQIVK